jgi:ABC-type nitrate/sulfonate/bicarbonate transport system permease component
MNIASTVFALLFLALWEVLVRLTGVPAYLVPGPIAIVQAFLAAPGLLLASLASTLLVTFVALIVSAALGVLAAAIAIQKLLKND